MFLVYIVVGAVVAWLIWRFALQKEAAEENQQTVTPEPVLPRIAAKHTPIPNEPARPAFDSSPVPSPAPTPNNDPDAWEGSFWDVREPFAVQAKLRFRYQDGAGSRTERTVDVREMGNDGYGILLIGHCHLRDATRTFRPERMTDCVDLETGEVVTDVYAYLREKYEQSPECARDRLVADEYDALRVLLFVGKADGQLREPEKVIIRQTYRTLAKDDRITDHLVDEAFSVLEVPSLAAFRMAVGRLAKKPLGTRTLLLESAEKIVATQKTVHPSEKEAVDYLKRRFAETNAESSPITTNECF